MENILKTSIELEKPETGLETSKIWGLVTMKSTLPPSLHIPPAFDIFVLLDAGMTMQDDKLRGIKESIILILSHLDKKHTFSLVVYNHSLELIISFMECSQENKMKIANYLDGIVPQSSANHYLGICKIFELIAKSKNPALFFFSSGLSNDHHRQTVLIKQIDPPKCCITNVIGAGTSQNSKLLYGISHHLKGVYHYAPTPLETFLITNKCITNVLSTLATEIEMTLECADGCRLISWSTSSAVEEKDIAKIYDIRINACAANETRTFIFALSLKPMKELETLDPKTGKTPIIWFVHNLALIKISYLNLVTGARETIEKGLTVLRVKNPGYFPLSDFVKDRLEKLNAINILNRYIKDPDPVFLTQLPEAIKKELLTLKGVHKNHSVCEYASYHFFEKFVEARNSNL